ncbi:MAG TPA: zinc dependent phospholipase C family protein [Verrucomicrobiae bacterium]
MMRRTNSGHPWCLPKTGSAHLLRRLSARRSQARVFITVLFATSSLCSGYSLLTHEEIVDILWKDQIQPLLLQRYPAASTNQLRQAHAFAYGGSLIQDVGYYPFGNKLFSDLTHCVRTGDFVANLVRESNALDEYAFALGALAHYSSDRSGHPLINKAVALCFPKLRAKYGDSVTYAQNPKAHIQAEFGFDITQVAKHRYTSDRYHDFIGFAVSKPVLERAFYKTYGLHLEEVLGHVDLAMGTFRHAVSRLIPEMTRAALTAYHPELVREIPNFNKREFLYNLSRAQYDREWGKGYRKPGLIARVLGFMVRWLPKVWLLEGLGFKLPTPQTEDLYVQSVNRAVEDYRTLLRQVGAANLQFPNPDCDTGRPAFAGEYALGDTTYAWLLETTIRRGLDKTAPDLRANLLGFYAGPVPSPNVRRKAWRRTVEEIEALRAGPNSALAAEVQRRLLVPPLKLASPKAKDG